ncbi:hypothetical protein VNO78_01583 [Psophocarpus tetragonolobus]|uniref:Uncharacterized protein n=1 Tax=Psophocarpus tetragonolobus TaxID=3891 RepID=A0AAN9T1R1_PSOTE
MLGFALTLRVHRQHPNHIYKACAGTQYLGRQNIFDHLLSASIQNTLHTEMMALRADSDYAFCSLASIVMSFHVYPKARKSTIVLQPTKNISHSKNAANVK